MARSWLKYLELHEAMLTGEFDLVTRAVGEAVMSGSVCVAGKGSLRLAVLKLADFGNAVAATRVATGD